LCDLAWGVLGLAKRFCGCLRVLKGRSRVQGPEWEVHAPTSSAQVWGSEWVAVLSKDDLILDPRPSLKTVLTPSQRFLQFSMSS
jgi:hypothetical protein